ncbi:hypothetical protein KJ966_11955 [bacterium]|nr:hypothetical protein [bacterium]
MAKTQYQKVNRIIEMVAYINYITIDCSMKKVFDYMTTPAFWPVYHPISDAAEKDPDPDFWLNQDFWPERFPLPKPDKNTDINKPLQKNGIVLETVSVGPLTQKVHWIGVESNGESHFCMMGKSNELGGVVSFIDYILSPNQDDPSKTDVKREVIYSEKAFMMKLLGLFWMNKFLSKYWKEALTNLKKILEEK